MLSAPLVFKGVSLVASLSVGSVVTAAVKNNVAVTGVVSKVATNVGALVLGLMAADQASKYVDDQLAKFAEGIKIEVKRESNEPEVVEEKEGP